MSELSEKVFLRPDEAEAMLPDSEQIHTFRQEGPCLLGCDIDRPKIIELFRKYKPELSGEKATAMNHGIVLKDDTGWLFIETRKE